jgi:hypothetical protein
MGLNHTWVDCEFTFMTDAPHEDTAAPCRARKCGVASAISTTAAIIAAAVVALLQLAVIVRLWPGHTRPAPVKIMILGNSISHGYEGDYT